jgi:hypothetical protein
MAAAMPTGNTGVEHPAGVASMRAITSLFVLLACLSAAALAADPPAQPRNRGEAREMFSADGLAKVSMKGIDVAYARPGARLSEYKSVLVRPVSVSLRRDWTRSGGMHAVRPRPEDVERIRARVASFVQEEFEKDLAEAGIAQAQAPGEDVLEIALSITDLYAAAPDVQVPGRQDVYAMSAGEMTLVGELRDSVSGETQFRFYDHGEAREWTRPRLILFNENETETRKLARSWAKALREGLQAARAQ